MINPNDLRQLAALLRQVRARTPNATIFLEDWFDAAANEIEADRADIKEHVARFEREHGHKIDEPCHCQPLTMSECVDFTSQKG